jgi:hypothetical protein
MFTLAIRLPPLGGNQRLLSHDPGLGARSHLAHAGRRVLERAFQDGPPWTSR